MICKGCYADKQLVKAHIIPESFFRDLRADEKTLLLISNRAGVHKKKAPIGVYDETILCRECEDRFEHIDDYAAKVLVNNDGIEKIRSNGEVTAYRLNEVDTDLIKLFVISLLWRASISRQDFYKKVNLGPLEQKAKDLVWEGSTGNRHDFSFVLAKFDDTEKISKVILEPHSERWFGRKYYRFYIASYVLYVKVDSQNTPKIWERFISSDNTLLLFSRGKLEDSKEYPMLVDAVKAGAKHN